MSDTEELARQIFIADNSRAPDPLAEWNDASEVNHEYARDIAARLIAIGYRRSPKDKDALDRIAYLVKEDCEGEGWTDMPGIIESISDYVERTGRDVSPHDD